MIGEPGYIREVIHILQASGVRIVKTKVDPDGTELSVRTTIHISGLEPQS